MTARKMVVGWDGSESSRAALDWAVRSGAPDGELLLLCVADANAAGRPELVDREPDDVGTTVEDAAARVARTHPGMRLRTATVHGDPTDELRRHAGPDAVLVVGTDAPGPLGVKSGWSVGGRLAASAAGSVAIVPIGARAEGSGVVVGVDGSEESLAAATFAAAHAERLGERLLVVHAWREPEVWENAFVFDEEFVESLEAQHDAVLADVVSVLTESFPAVTVTASLVRGAASWALLDAARDAALLVVGCRGHRGVKRLFLGSVSHSVVLNIVGPTVVVGHGREDATAPSP